MRKLIVTLTLALALAPGVSACGSKGSAATQAVVVVAPSAAALPTETAAETAVLAEPPTTAANTERLNADFENAVSVEYQLLLGTLKLEEAGRPITAEQAAALLPLWQSYQELSQANMPAQGEAPAEPASGATPAPVEVDSETRQKLDDFVTKIQEVMTAEQVKAISAMRITQETAQTLLTELGIEMGGGPGGGQGGGPGGGQGGGPGGGQGGGPGGEQGGTPPEDGQAPAGGEGGTGGQRGEMIPQGVVNAVIELLTGLSAQ